MFNIGVTLAGQLFLRLREDVFAAEDHGISEEYLVPRKDSYRGIQ